MGEGGGPDPSLLEVSGSCIKQQGDKEKLEGRPCDVS